MTLKLIQLSDLHVTSRTCDEYHALEKIVDHVVENHHDGVVVITGDLVNHGRLDEFAAIAPLLAYLRNGCRRLLVVPGNHCVETYGTLGGVFSWPPWEGGTNAEPFNNFRRSLFGAAPDYPQQVDVDGVSIVLVDSTAGAAGASDLARGEVGYSQRVALGEELAGCKRPRVVALHHHPFERRNWRGVQLDDADEFMATLSGRCDLLLFGHKHEAGAWSGVYGVDKIFASDKTTESLSYRVFEVGEGGVISWATEQVGEADHE